MKERINGVHAISYATNERNHEMLDYMLRNPPYKIPRVYQVILRRFASLHSIKEALDSSLLKACDTDDFRSVELLVTHGANLEAKDEVSHFLLLGLSFRAIDREYTAPSCLSQGIC
jgi:hypothetical protein